MTDMNEFILGLARPEPSAGGAGSSTDNADDDPPTPTGPRAVLQANLDKAAAGLAAGSPAPRSAANLKDSRRDQAPEDDLHRAARLGLPRHHGRDADRCPGRQARLPQTRPQPNSTPGSTVPLNDHDALLGALRIALGNPKETL